jgi:FKBP-type peptidyl-prolyl cis-trans isomerase
MEKNKNMIWIWALIVVLVIAALVFITIKYKHAPSQSTTPSQEPNTNMQTQPVTEQIPGVNITILKEGTGDAVQTGDSVTVNYTGMLTDGTVFDSNVDPKFNHVQPFDFTLGAGQVIKGWDTGVVGMKVGEIRKLEISPDFAYGATGAGNGAIPPNASLIFLVELVSINK